MSVIFCLIWLNITITALYAFDDQDTHPRITEKAIAASSLGGYLNNNLGFTSGSRSPINGTPIF